MSFCYYISFVVFYVVLCSFYYYMYGKSELRDIFDESLSTNIQHSLTMGSSLDILELLTIHSPS